ncbi:collectin-11-like [Branchiostoma floridae x Branchiostoma belcheri]
MSVFPVLCPNEYTEFRGICYKTSTTPKAFSDAALACLQDGGTLAMPKDSDTNAFLTTLLTPSDHFWLGLHDRIREGSFEWMDGTPLGKFTPWGKGQPNYLSDVEDCVTLSDSRGLSVWSDMACHEGQRFICQIVPGHT